MQRRLFLFQTKIALEAEEVNASNQKLQRRLIELREQLTRETSLRSTLEESNNSLTRRIQEMESNASSERDEVWRGWHLMGNRVYIIW